MSQVHRVLHGDEGSDSVALLPMPASATSQSAPRRRLRVVITLALAAFVLGNVLFLQQSVLVKQTQLLANHDALEMLKDAWGVPAKSEPEPEASKKSEPAVIAPTEIEQVLNRANNSSSAAAASETLDSKTQFAMSLWTASKQEPQQQRGIVLPLFDKIATLGMSLILELRAMDVDLPIEVPHCGDLDQKFQTELMKRDPLVRVYDVCTLATSYKNEQGQQLFCHHLEHCHVRFRGFDIKVISLVLSRFQQVMLMDADTLYFRSPMPLWDSKQYKTTGAFFFNDRVVQEQKFLGQFLQNSSPRVTVLQNYLSRFDITPFRLIPTIPRAFASDGPAAKARAKRIDRPLGFTPSDVLLTSHSWNHRSGHQVDSSLLLWDKTRQPRATVILAWFMSMLSDEHPPGYGDKELFFMASELAETAYAFSDIAVGTIGVVRRTYFERSGKKNHVLCGDAMQFLPTGINASQFNTTKDTALPLYFNGDNTLMWKPSNNQISRTRSRTAEFYNGSNRERGIPLICAMDSEIVKLSEQEEQRVAQRQTLHEVVLEWFE